MRKVILSLILTSSLYASPEGMKVVSGNAVLSNNQKETNIKTGERTIINWDKFSIAKDELTRFSQPSSFSTVLNRVTGKEMSKILGKLESNGRVYLLNPNGVIIGKDAYINAASFIASTYDVLDSDFLKNEDLWFFGESNEKIVNLGTIKAFDGDAILIGRTVQNEGSITSEKGIVALGAGKEILLKPLDKERIYIKPQMEKESGKEKDGETGIENSGEIKAVSSYLKADGNLYSLAIKNSGSIDALSFQEKDGEIFLIAENSTLENSGVLKAKRENSGGEVRVLGKNVGLLGNACIDVSHEKDGGVVLVGGDFQGKNQDIYNANAVFMSKEANINASSLNNGDGGKVILWGNDVTRFYGNILAEGGKEKGNGGLVEVSGKYLEYRGKVSSKALNGKDGLLFLDPAFLEIFPPPASSNPPFPGGPGPYLYQPPYTGSDAILLTTDVQNALANNNVTISTQSSSDWEGIFVNSGSQITWNTANTLTLQTTNFQQDVLMASTGPDTFFHAAGGGQIIINSTSFATLPGKLLPGNGNVYLQTDNGKIIINVHDVVDHNGRVDLEGGSTGGFAEIIATGSGTIDITADSVVTLLSLDILNSNAHIKAENGNININITEDASTLSIQANADENLTLRDISAGIYTTGTGSITINTNTVFIDGSHNSASANSGIFTFGSGNINITASANGNYNITGNQGPAIISSGNTLSMTPKGEVFISAAGTGQAFLTSLNTLTMSSVNSLTMRAVGANTFISTTGVNQNIKINDASAKGSGGLKLNDVPGFSSYIATDNGGNIECYFSGISIINGNANPNSFGAIVTGRLTNSGNITFSSGDLSITAGSDVTSPAGFFTANGALGNISLDVGLLTVTAGAGRAGFFASTAGGNITGSTKGITLTSASDQATIFAPNGSITLTNNNNDISLTAGGAANCSISCNTNLSLQAVKSITMIPTSADTYIRNGESGGSGTLNINSSSAGAGGIILNQAAVDHASYIATLNGGDITCLFSAASSFTAGAGANHYSGIFTGLTSGSGNINFSSGNITILAGANATAYAGLITSNAAAGSITMNVGSFTATASTGRAGAFASTAGGDITGSTKGIALTSSTGQAAISAPGGAINLTNNNNNVSLTAGGSGSCFISCNTNLTLQAVNSITMVPTSADTYIRNGESGGNGTLNINSATAGAGGIILNQAAADHASYIATLNGGDITCLFSAASSFTAGASANHYSGLFTGLTSGNGSINFSSGNITILAGADATAYAGLITSNVGAASITMNVGSFTATASTGRAGAFASTAGGDITGSTKGIILTSSTGQAAISAPGGAINLTNNNNNVSLTAGGSGNCFISCNTNLALQAVNSITMVPTSADTYIRNGESGGNGTININSATAGAGGIILNQAAADHASYIATLNGGNITCLFSAASSFTAGAGANHYSGIFTGLTSGSGNINFSSGNLTIQGGGNATAYAGLITANAAVAAITMNVGSFIATANTGRAGAFASTAGGNITGSTNLINLTSGAAEAAISAPGGAISLTNNTGSISLTAAGSGDCFIGSLNNLTLLLVNSITTNSRLGKTYIQTTGGGNILINSSGAKGGAGIILNQIPSLDNFTSYIATQNGGNIECYFSGTYDINGGSGINALAGILTGVISGSGDITIESGNLFLDGGTAFGCSSNIETLNGGNISINSSIDVQLFGGSSSCKAIIQTDTVGEIDISAVSVELHAGAAPNAPAYIQTLGAALSPINITAGEVLLTSSTTDITSEAAIQTFDPSTNFVRVIANGVTNSAGDISIIANAAPAFINNAILIQAAHDLLLDSVNNDAYILTTSSSPFFIPVIDVGNELTMNGSPNTPNVAKITPIGAPTSINISVGDDARLIAAIGSSFISGYSNINMFTGDALIIQSGLLGAAFIDSTANANFSLDSLSITSFIAPARITAPLNLNILVYDNNLSLTSTVNANAFIQGGNTSIDVNGNLIMSSLGSGAAFIQSTDYSLFNVGRDISLSGNGSNITKTGLSPFVMTAGDSIFVNDSSFFQNASGPFTILAGQDIQINGGRIENLSSDDLTLVVDNNFPVSPEIGDGHFDITAGSILRTAPGGKLRIFTAAREFNSIESSLNGVAFVPGTLFEDSNFEVWGVYYPSSFFGGPGFTIFYKNVGDISHAILSAVDFAASELFFRINNMLPDLFILDYLEKFIDRSKYFFVDDERDLFITRERYLLKLIRE